MNLSDLFTSRHTKWLEREIEELKKTHALEMERVITQNQRLQDELQRTRILLTPGLQAVSLPHEHDDSPPPVSAEPTGTPWMRVRARELKRLDDEWRAQQEKNAAAAKGDANGSIRSGSNSPSLGEPSKPS